MEDIYWECFFNNAGISGPSSKDYASIFVKNKISQSILTQLNDSHLKAMGIEAVGDVIRILKYIKDFPQIEKSSKIIKETAERFIEILPVTEMPKEMNTNKAKMCSTYEKVPGFEIPVPTRRIVTPEIEGRYKIKHPSKSTASKIAGPPPPPTISTDKAIPMSTSHRIVILSDSSKFEPKTQHQTTSVLKRLGKSLEKYERFSSCDDNNNNDYADLEFEDDDEQPDVPAKCKKPKLQTTDNKTILKRFFNATLSRDSQMKLLPNSKVPMKSVIETNKANVFLRLGSQDDGNSVDCGLQPTKASGLPYMGVFKLPHEPLLVKPGGADGTIEVRSGHTTDSIRRVEATSTTSSSLQHHSNKSQSIRDRLGHR